MIPVGLNTGGTAMNHLGGPDKYYARLKGAYNVSRIMGNMLDEDIQSLQDCQGPALNNGIKLLPVLLFPNIFIWKYNYMAASYPDINKFWMNGAAEFIDRAIVMLNCLDHENLFAVELLNEVQFDSLAKVEFAVTVVNVLRQIFPGLPLTISRPFPTGLDTIHEKTVTAALDILTFHTYGPTNLEWYLSPIRNEWTRLQQRLLNVRFACESVAVNSLGKPFICTEDPCIPVRGPFGDFFCGLFNKPQDKDLTNHYIQVSRSYLEHGAMGPGMQWSNCIQDLPNSFVEAIRKEGFIDN